MTLPFALHVLFHCRAVRFGLSGVGAIGCWLGPATLLAQTISYVQGNYATPQTPQITVSVNFTAAQIGGDLNVVVVGWNDSIATVSAVNDTAGNSYTRAVGPTVISGVESQSIYYAKNIAAAAAGTNTVTVTFSAAAAYPDIRILEYSGADPANPVDVTAVSSGNSATSRSTSVTTTNATDLLFGANIVQTLTIGPGNGFTGRLLTAPDGDIAEDRMVTTVGTYSAIAPLSSGQWIMQMVAFRTAPTVSFGINYVQGNYATPQTAQITVSVEFSAAQIAGDLNVVVVGWNDSITTVNAVSDTAGNPYTRAVGPTVIGGVESQSIYYANNIAAAAAGTNIVTVTFSAAAAYPDIRILEYSGADPANPVDVTAASSGNSATSRSTSVTTTNATDLLFGANIVQTLTTGPGNGFTSRLLTAPDGDIAEDRMVTTIGSYSATAPLGFGQWIMQMVAFRTPSGGGATPLVNLSSTSINFGSVPTGITSSPQSLTLTNVGDAPLTISSIVVSGGEAGDFAETSTCGATVSPNGGCTINVIFTPSTTGARSSTVTLADNAPGAPQTIALSGTGTGLSITPRVSVLTVTRTQQFTASIGSVAWSVDGREGGSISSGTITSTGLYTAPSGTGSHTVTATLSSLSASATVYITNYPGTFTYHNDNLRTGQNLNETVLTLSNVNYTQFGKLFSYLLDGIAFASPLYVANVNISGQGFHNVVYVATEHDSVYAFEADGLSSTPLWKVSFLGPGVTPIPCADTGECGDIPTEIGITGTPVIDQTSGTMYVVAATKEGTNYVQRLHALDVATGSERFGGPVVLQGIVAGTGDGASGGNVAFDALRENQRPGLLLNNGVVYIAFASHGDQHPWHGWVLGYNSTTLQQTIVYNVSPDGYGGGVWQSGGGLATDSTGSIFFSTGNGDFTASTGGRDYGDTVVKLDPAGSVVDFFTPYDQATLESLDLDLSSAGPVLLLDQPGPIAHVLITAGKGGTIYVINRDNMGHIQPSNNDQIIQSLPGVLPHGTLEQGNFSAPVLFNNYVYFGAVNDTLKAFQWSGGLLSAAPTSQSSAMYPNRGGSFAISANGSASGILWAIQDNSPVNGVLHAYDAGNLALELYNSSQSGSRDTLDVASKFSIPLIANGKVFVASNGQLTAFGLLP